MLATYGAVIAHLRGDDLGAAAALAAADERLADAQRIVTARHADLHDTHRRRLVDKTSNRTFYQFGYLFMADTLCYWHRELAEVRGVLGDSSAIPPSCVF